jgi:hypothetical protein
MANKKDDNPWWQHHKKFYGENFEYQDFAPMFKAEYFNPEQWADLFYRSGANILSRPQNTTKAFASGTARRLIRPGADRGMPSPLDQNGTCSAN